MNAEGWLDQARHIASPNCSARASGEKPHLLVVHNISLPPGEYGGPYIADLFLNRLDPNAHPYFSQIAGLRVSSHFLIGRDGALTQFVSTEQAAWHAGQSCHRGRDQCNGYSIGIELEGTDTIPYTDAQYAALAQLTRQLVAAYPITDVAGHLHIAPSRKTDPGASFDWPRYRALVPELVGLHWADRDSTGAVPDINDEAAPAA